jgi:hypothetical protein
LVLNFNYFLSFFDIFVSENEIAALRPRTFAGCLRGFLPVGIFFASNTPPGAKIMQIRGKVHQIGHKTAFRRKKSAQPGFRASGIKPQATPDSHPNKKGTRESLNK